MALRLRLVLVALLTVVTGMVVSGPVAAKDDSPVVSYQGFELHLISAINRSRALSGAQPLSATHSINVYAYYSATGDWACNGKSNPTGLDQVESFGINPSGYVERVSDLYVDTQNSEQNFEAAFQDLVLDNALLDPALAYIGLVSVSGGPQCPDIQRTVAVAADDMAWFGQLVSMVSLANGKFVTAEAGGSQPLIANRDAVGDWELFDLVQLSATDVSMRSLANGRYVTAEAAGTQSLIANRSSVGQWETFSPVLTPDGTTALFSRADNCWVTAEAAGTQPLIANRIAIGQWEQFELRGPDGGSLQANSMPVR